MRARPQAGYSLIELLVVLALIGLMAIAMSGGIHFGARVWERTESDVEGGEIARSGHALLRSLLASVSPRQPDPNRKGEAPAFSGARDRITFLVAAPASLGALGVARVELTARRDGRVASLAISYRAERGPANAQQHIVLTGAREIVFSYARISGGALAWSDHWQLPGAVPALIRVRAAFPPGSGVSWPDLIVRPNLDRDAACIFDPVSFGCRHG